MKYLAGLGLAVLLIAWVLRGTDPQRLRETIATASITGLLASGMLQIGHNLFRVWRWRVLLQPIGRAGVGSMLAACVIGYLVSWVLPGRLGELVRPALLAGRENLPLVPTVGTVVVDRLTDAVAIVALFGAGLVLTPLQGEAAAQAATLRPAAILFLPISLSMLLGLWGLARWRQRLEPLFAKRGGLVGRVGRMVVELGQAGEALRHPMALLQVGLLSLAIWITIAFGLWVGMVACGAELPVTGVWILLPAIALGVSLPTPGGAGGFHAAVKFGLVGVFGASNAVATGTSFLLHLAAVVPVLVAGLLVIACGWARFSDLRTAIAQMRQAGAATGSAASG